MRLKAETFLYKFKNKKVNQKQKKWIKNEVENRKIWKMLKNRDFFYPRDPDLTIFLFSWLKMKLFVTLSHLHNANFGLQASISLKIRFPAGIRPYTIVWIPAGISL